MSKTIEDANGIDWCQRAIDAYLNSGLVARTKKRLHMSEATLIEAMELAFSNGFMVAQLTIEGATADAVRTMKLKLDDWRKAQHKRTAGKGRGRKKK